MPPGKKDGAGGGAVTVNRAPVLTLWASVVAERLGFDRAEALTLGKTVAGLNAQSKGRALGIFAPSKKAEAERRRKGLRQGETTSVLLLHRAVPCVRTADGLRALNKDRPVEPDSVERYLAAKFGDALAATRRAMEQLARAMDPETLAEKAYGLYEAFRPEVPKGTRGWGKAGVLSLERIRSLASPKRGE
jgi:uncharacterized membrane protein